jgi:hypothetical protein
VCTVISVYLGTYSGNGLMRVFYLALLSLVGSW